MRKIAYGFVWFFAVSIPLQELAASIFVEVAGTVSRLIGLAAGLVAFVAVIQEGRLRSFSVTHGIMAIYFAWGGLSFLWSQDQPATLARLLTSIQLLLMVLIFCQFATTREEVHGFVTAYVIGSGISIVELLRRKAMGLTYYSGYFEDRYTAFGNNPNEYALALALAIPMAWYLVMSNRKRWEVLLGWGLIAGGGLGVILTGSRGGFLSLAVAALIIPFSLHRLTGARKIASVGFLVFGVVVALAMTPQNVWNRLAKIEELAPANVPKTYYGELEGPNIRTVIWKQGFNEFVNNPEVAVVGVGAAAYVAGVEPLYGERYVAHNVFISVLVEQGVIGFSLFLIIIWLLVSKIRFLERDEKYLWAFSFMTWFVGVNFMTWEHTKNTWFLFGLLAARTVHAKLPPKRKRSMFAPLLPR
jgi:hypothetical protein